MSLKTLGALPEDTRSNWFTILMDDFEMGGPGLWFQGKGNETWSWVCEITKRQVCLLMKTKEIRKCFVHKVFSTESRKPFELAMLFFKKNWYPPPKKKKNCCYFSATQCALDLLAGGAPKTCWRLFSQMTDSTKGGRSSSPRSTGMATFHCFGNPGEGFTTLRMSRQRCGWWVTCFCWNPKWFIDQLRVVDLALNQSQTLETLGTICGFVSENV